MKKNFSVLTDTFESKRGKLQLWPTGTLRSFSTKFFIALCAMETDLISQLWRRAQLSLTPWHWEDRQQSFTALLHGRDPLNTVLTGGVFSSSSLSTGISSHTFHTSARSDHSCHGSAFCSTLELLEQRHTDSLTDEAEDSQQGPGSTLCLHCWCVLAPQPIINCAAWKQLNSRKGCQN